jgi:SNF2 family DNA or RNA helicase
LVITCRCPFSLNIMAADELLRSVVEITNDLSNFVPFGVVFLTNWKGLSCRGITSSDNAFNGENRNDWRWLDLPYTDVEGMSELVKGMVLLVRRGWCRLTYKVFDSLPGIAVVRIHMMNEDSQYSPIIDQYRERYFRFKRSVEWLDKRCRIVMQNILLLTDFSLQAWNIGNARDLERYLKNNTLPLIRCITENNEPLAGCPVDISRFNLKRMAESRPWSRYEGVNVSEETSMQYRLKKIYLNINSPKINQALYDEDDKRIYDMIENNQIKGLRSELYNFQKRSVMNMYQRELNQTFRLMPHIIELRREGMHKGFFNLKTMKPVKEPATYTPPRGGILAENMGLGKTFICLALICVSKFQVSEIPSRYKALQDRKSNVDRLFNICVNNIAQNSIPWREYYNDFPPHITRRLESVVGYFKVKKAEGMKRSTRHSGGLRGHGDSSFKKMYLSSTTLIVLPDNLFHQWRVEILKHIDKDMLRVLAIQTSEEMENLNQTDILKIVENDILLISNSAFSKQNDLSHSLLQDIYWKRLVIDEGHSMKSKISKAVLLTKTLMYERMWVISGTPTSGLTNLHVENENQEYTVQNVFDPKQDLNRLGAIVQNFFKIEPWCTNNKLWADLIVKPFQSGEFNIEYMLSQFLEQLMVRHTISDVEVDIKLPTLHHKPVFIKPSYFDKISINLFIAVLATNAVTSERKGIDFMFDSSNKADLRRLVTNLQKGTFYWTGFSISDVENLLNICVYSLRKHADKYHKEDKLVLEYAIFISKLALSNMRWRSVSTLHEMGFFVDSLPKSIVNAYSLDRYKKGTSMYGYPHLVSIQKFFYKNRMIRSRQEFSTKILAQSQEFWSGYWKNLNRGKDKGKSSKVRASSGETRPLSNQEEYKEFELADVREISKLPNWVETFNARLEEKLVYDKFSKDRVVVNGHQRKHSKRDTGYVEAQVSTHEQSSLRDTHIVGTLSAKLNYLAMRLLENQMQGIKSIVFYEFENSAYYLTELLDLLGMNYLMYSPYIKVFERSNNLAQFDRWEAAKNEGEGITLIMDLKLASHGLTIIAATRVFFINPVWNQSIEAQAIKRSHRIGQMNEVFVETLILEGTLEEKMYNMRAEVTNSNKIELIDHEGIKNYILQFPFLRMFDGDENVEEYADFNVKSGMLGSVERADVGNNDYDDDDALLRKPSNLFDSRLGTRKWTLPLFTKKNLDKLALQNSSVGQKRRYDNIEEIENELTTASDNEISATSKIMEKLRNKRKRLGKVRFSV